MKNCIIIHGCPSNIEKAMDPQTRTFDKHWIQWTKNKLNELGIQTEAPLMPEPWNASYATWKEVFEKYPINENTILIGHSCGCAFLTRWLGETKIKIDKLILVAPWKTPAANSTGQKREFYEFDIDPEIAKRCNKIIIFTSDTESPQGKKDLALYREILDGKVIDLPGRGHYIFEAMGTEEFPELINEAAK